VTAPITVREYASLTTLPVPSPTLARAHISADDFDWLCQQSRRFRVTHGVLAAEGEDGNQSKEAPLVEVLDRRCMRLDNYVGVIELPSGQLIEILPKTASDGDDPSQGRRLLRQMLECALDLPPREASEAVLQGFDAPLSEWVMARFLAALQHLVKRGVRSDYLRIEGEERFLRGQLDVVRQMRQPPGRAHHFALRYDLFLPDRAENRLLKLALEQVAVATQSPESWRLAQELRHLLVEVPASRDVTGDFRQWRDDRLMAHYREVRPWCELILLRIMPVALRGVWRGISLLFPMETLFERYVEAGLRRQLLPWKRLDGSDEKNNYGISQADLYQLFAYGHKYLGGQGDLVLIYPAWERFKAPLDPFCFDNDNQLRLWVLPFELGQGVAHQLLLPVRSVGDRAPVLDLPLRTDPITELMQRA